MMVIQPIHGAVRLFQKSEDCIPIFVLVAVDSCRHGVCIMKPKPSTKPTILAAQAGKTRPDRADFLRRMARTFVPRPWRQATPGLTKLQAKERPVKIKLRFLGIKPREQWKKQVAKEIDALGKVAAMSSAEVVLEGRRLGGDS